MIKDRAMWQKWEADYIRSTPVDVERNFAIVDALYEEARSLGIFPLQDPLEGMEEKIRFVKAVHVPATPRKDRE